MSNFSKGNSVPKHKKTGRFTLPANLSFRRSVDVSDGLLSSVMPDGTLRPVTVAQVTVRGAMGNSTAGYDKRGNPLIGEALEKAQNPTKPNIQSIDRANLDPASDLLDLSYSLALHDGGKGPDACSKADYGVALQGFLSTAREHGIYEDLAARYLWNLVNGRVLWRNGCGLPAGCMLTMDGRAIRFDWGALRERVRFPGVDALKSACADGGKAVEALVSSLAAALRGDTGILAVDVSIRVRLYHGAEVWPSQEFVEETQRKRNGREISRVLASRMARVDGVVVRQGVMHSQKLGNAIRTIDEWHGDAAFGAIPVEAFGWIQSELAALRSPADADAGLDAYRALERVALTAEALASGDADAKSLALYTSAVIVRGGVYGVSEKEEAAGGE